MRKNESWRERERDSGSGSVNDSVPALITFVNLTRDRREDGHAPNRIVLT